MHYHFRLIALHSDIDMTQYKYATELSSGIDLRAYLQEPVILKPGKRASIPTGLMCEFVDRDAEGQIRPRSGLAANHGITVLNAPGTIDADYQGEIKVILYNTGEEDFVISNGDRIAQFVLGQVIREPMHLSKFYRGNGGFGSTGVL